MKTQTITIIGMGRTGVSIGLALKRSSLPVEIIGHDRDAALTRQAKEELAAIDKMKWNLIKAVSVADILVLAIPVSELEETLQVIGGGIQAHTLVLDLSSLKGPGLQWAEQYLQQGHYVGARPVLAAPSLAEGRTGLESARADLFKNSVFCLMPSVNADPRAVETAVNFGLILGATPYFVDPVEYDSLIQGVETIPGLLAAALFNTAHKATGWRDILRFAGLPFAHSTLPLRSGADIAHLALNDKEATLRWLDALFEELRQVRRWVYEGEADVLAAVLEELNVERERWLNERTRNNWVDLKSPPIEVPGFTGQMFGSLGRKLSRREDESDG